MLVLEGVAAHFEPDPELALGRSAGYPHGRGTTTSLPHAHPESIGCDGFYVYSVTSPHCALRAEAHSLFFPGTSGSTTTTTTTPVAVHKAFASATATTFICLRTLSVDRMNE